MPKRMTNKFTKKITIQKKEVIYDELGQEDGVEWVDVKKLWAMIKTLQGREYYAAAATQSESSVRFVTRYTDGIDDSMRVVYKGRIFEIVAPPINDDEKNETLTIITKEVFDDQT